jgi:hypothetical protein
VGVDWPHRRHPGTGKRRRKDADGTWTLAGPGSHQVLVEDLCWWRTWTWADLEVLVAARGGVLSAVVFEQSISRRLCWSLTGLVGLCQTRGPLVSLAWSTCRLAGRAALAG